MMRALLVTAPYTGTHFAAELLRTLGVDFGYCHAYPYYLRDWNIPAWCDADVKLVITLRNPWSSLHSCWNRNPDTREQHMAQQFAALQVIETLRAKYSPFIIRLDERPTDPNKFVTALARYCGGSVTAEAQAYAATWPVVGNVPYTSPATPELIVPDMVYQLCSAWGYSEKPTWNHYVPAPVIGPTRDEIHAWLVKRHAALLTRNGQ